MSDRGLLALAVVLAACSGNAAESTTTTSQPVLTVTTSQPATTTTSSTTSTSSPTTTTTRPADTVPDGVSVIASQGAVMGVWSDAWIVPESPADLPPIGSDWQAIQEPGLPIEELSAGLLEETEFCEPIGIARPLLAFDLGEPWLAVQANWPLIPHKVEDFTGQLDVYVEAVTTLLAGQGLVVETAHIEQLVRTDLEGDGVDEVIVVATEGDRVDIYTPATVEPFEVVLLRKVIEGDVQTAILALRLPDETLADQGPDNPPFPFLFEFRIIGVGDLNGDGTMEIGLRDRYYEGQGISIWEYVNDDLGPVRVLDLGCGV